MEKTLVLYDKDSQYTGRLQSFLRNRSEIPFKLHTFQSLDALKEFNRHREIDILLYSSKDDAEKLRHFCQKELIFLSDGEENKGSEYSEFSTSNPNEKSIYKYQSGDSIVRELMSYYGDYYPAFSNGKRSGRAELFMIFSPIGCSGKTRLSLSLAKILSESRRTLFLSFEESAWFPALLQHTGRGSLTEMLYYYKEGTLDSMKIRSLCYSENGIDYVPPIQNPEDLSVLSKKEFLHFLEDISIKSTYETIVLDTDSIISRFYDFFPLCSRIFVPVKDDTMSLKKLEKFEKFLDNSEPDIKDRMVKLSLPAHKAGHGSNSGFAAFLNEEMLSFAFAVAKNYIL